MEYIRLLPGVRRLLRALAEEARQEDNKQTETMTREQLIKRVKALTELLDRAEYKISAERKAAPLGEIVESAADDVSEAHKEAADILCTLASETAKAAKAAELRKRSINWEQRCYEVARDLFVSNEDYDADDAINIANTFIEVLRGRDIPCD